MLVAVIVDVANARRIRIGPRKSIERVCFGIKKGSGEKEDS